MDLGLSGKGVVVTGGSKGIGRAMALAFAAEGAAVATCARGAEALASVEAELREIAPRSHCAACDVGDADALRAFLDAARKELGSVDVLVNNVSALAMGNDISAWKASLDVDLLAPVLATEHVIPWMIEAGEGAVIHVSSISGVEAGSPPAYAAAKAALISHAKTMSANLARKGVRVNTISPGSIEFPDGVWDVVKKNNRSMYDGVVASIPGGRMGTPEEVAQAAVFLASPKASWINGVCLYVDGGQHKGNL
ncbi:MAG: SDR family oxidoreductase [Myxococcales bacterium]|nr:SDR family oxidoreductase [Myxococcales bacterium]